MLLGAHTYSGAEALGFGLVQRQGDVDDALGWADALSELAPLTIFGHKIGLNALEDFDDAPDDYRAAFAKAWGSADLQEGLQAFRDRRPPMFRGE